MTEFQKSLKRYLDANWLETAIMLISAIDKKLGKELLEKRLEEIKKPNQKNKRQMKLYAPTKEHLTRVQITYGQKSKQLPTEHISFNHTNNEDVQEFIKTSITSFITNISYMNGYLIKENIKPISFNPFEKIRTQFIVRECMGSKNLESKSISMVGLLPKDAHYIIMQSYFSFKTSMELGESIEDNNNVFTYQMDIKNILSKIEDKNLNELDWFFTPLPNDLIQQTY